MVLFMLLSGCAGYRSGVVSQAYVGVEPAGAAVVADAQNWLAVPGARLRAELNNKIQHNEHQVILFIVPVMVDPLDKPLYQPGQNVRLLLEISPEAGVVHFQPEQVVLSIDGREHRPTGVQQLVAFDPGEYPLPAQRDAEERNPAGLGYTLDTPKRHHQFSLRFATPIPTPTQDIRLDISGAVKVPGQPPAAPIRFRVARWKQGYT